VTDANEAERQGGMERLRTRIARVKTRGGRPSLERWLLLAGAATIAAGIPLIFIGWYGAAHTPYVFEQIPYLISGGLLGLALAIVGGLFYFSFWLTRQVQETRRQGEESRALLVRLEQALLSQNHNGSGPGNGSYVATKSGSMVHRADCVVVANRTDLRPVSADEPGLEPCKICDPLSV
jgi:hypothetical protein